MQSGGDDAQSDEEIPLAETTPRREVVASVLVAVLIVAISVGLVWYPLTHWVGTSRDLTMVFSGCSADRARGEFEDWNEDWLSDPVPPTWRNAQVAGTVTFTTDRTATFSSGSSSVAFSTREPTPEERERELCGHELDDD